MAFHRIKKYSRQIVCQDCILSCQPDHIEEIPFLRSAQVGRLSLRNQRATSIGERSTWLERDLDLSGMLLCWHLLNSRSMPFFARGKKVESRLRTTSTDKREKICHSFLTLRDQTLYTAIEKYLLFLMAREMKKERLYNHSLGQWPCKTGYAKVGAMTYTRRDRVRLSALYVHTALGLCQYKIQCESKSTLLNNGVVAVRCKPSVCKPPGLQEVCKEKVEPISLALSPEKMFFPCAHKVVGSTQSDPYFASLQSLRSVQNMSEVKHNYSHTKVRGPLCETLSLYSSSVLNSPDIQDIAQSGLVTLEGSLTLEFL